MLCKRTRARDCSGLLLWRLNIPEQAAGQYPLLTPLFTIAQPPIINWSKVNFQILDNGRGHGWITDSQVFNS